MLLPVSVYGGYFGAGVGVLLLARAVDRDRAAIIARPMSTKNLVTGLNTVRRRDAGSSRKGASAGRRRWS